MIVGVVPGQRHREIEAQSEIGQRLSVARRLKTLAALEDLEDELLVLAAFAAGEEAETLHRRRLDPDEAPATIDVEDRGQGAVAQVDFIGEHVAHASRWGRREVHGHVTSGERAPAAPAYSGRVMMIWVSPESRKRPVFRRTESTREGPESPGMAPRPLIIPSKPDCTTCMRKPAGPR